MRAVCRPMEAASRGRLKLYALQQRSNVVGLAREFLMPAAMFTATARSSRDRCPAS